jgi:hypothetical protein
MPTATLYFITRNSQLAKVAGHDEAEEGPNFPIVVSSAIVIQTSFGVRFVGRVLEWIDQGTCGGRVAGPYSLGKVRVPHASVFEACGF